jgi:ribonuclease D
LPALSKCTIPVNRKNTGTGDILYIKKQQELINFCDAAKKAGLIGIDLEFIPENTYYPRLALVQVVHADTCKLIDPLGTLDLTPLDNLIHDPDVTKVVHAGSQDMGIFYHRSGLLPQNVFDTQIACSFINMGAQISYGGMVQELFDVILPKTQSYTNWLKRPLTENQEKYAIEDVQFLLPAYHKIQKQLHSQNRTSWASEEFDIYGDPSFYQIDPDRALYKVKNRNRVKNKNLAVLQQLAAWREKTARKKNLPRKRILHDDTLVEIALKTPQSQNTLLSLRCTDLHNVKRNADALLKAVRSGLSRPDIPEQKKQKHQPLSEKQKHLVDFLLFCLKSHCTEQGVAPQRAASKNDIEQFVLHLDNQTDSKNILMTGWRREFAGEMLYECLNGNKTVSFEPSTGKIIIC